MKDCKKIHPLLPFYIEEKLSPAERQRVEKHLDACEAARVELRHFRQVMDSLHQMPDPPVPHDLHAKIMAKLGAPAHATPPHRFFLSPQVWALAAAAVLVFVVVTQVPEWRDNLRVRPTQSQNEITNLPKQEAPPAAPAPFPGSANGTLAKKSAAPQKDTFKANVDTLVTSSGAPRSAEKAMSPAQLEEKAAGAPAPMAASAEAPSIPRKAKETLAKAVEAQEASAPPAAAPRPEAMDQSLQSLTYTREQSVTVWNGNGGPATLEQQELLTDADSFQKYWQVSHPGETPPAVDFTSQAVVVLMAGEKPTAGYSIHVSRLEEKTDQLVIHYKLESPAPGAVTAQIITHPWALQVIPKPSKPVTFIQDDQ